MKAVLCRILCLLMAIVLTVSLFGCDNAGNPFENKVTLKTEGKSYTFGSTVTLEELEKNHENFRHVNGIIYALGDASLLLRPTEEEGKLKIVGFSINGNNSKAEINGIKLGDKAEKILNAFKGADYRVTPDGEKTTVIQAYYYKGVLISYEEYMEKRMEIFKEGAEAIDEFNESVFTISALTDGEGGPIRNIIYGDVKAVTIMR